MYRNGIVVGLTLAILGLANACAGNPVVIEEVVDGGSASAASTQNAPDAAAPKQPAGEDAATPTPPAQDASPPPALDAGPSKCPGKAVLCNGKCLDTSTDVANCGRCGNACKKGDTCAGSACVAPGGAKSCATGLQLCGASCTSTLIDPLNCGRCGHACNILNGELCALGKCEAIGSGGGSSGGSGPGNACGDPSLQMCDGYCVPYDDLDNCGSCDNACDVESETCNGTNCVGADPGTGCPPSDPCCGNSDPCCGSSDPCCGSSDPCCGSSDEYCCQNPDDPSCN